MSDPLRVLLEKDRVIDTINQLFVSTDKRDWPAVRHCFAESVLFDMTSVAGGKPSPMTPEQISAAWEQGLRPIEAIHQQNTRTFVGSYDFHLLRLESRWRIDSFRFNLKFLDGNLELEQAE